MSAKSRRKAKAMAAIQQGLGTGRITAGYDAAVWSRNRSTITHAVQDATKDPDREANGQIVVTVQGVPEAPGTPLVSSVQDRTVVVSYGAPSNNGAEITKYTGKSVGGSPYSSARIKSAS